MNISYIEQSRELLVIAPAQMPKTNAHAHAHVHADVSSITRGLKPGPSLHLQCTAILRVLEQRYFGICSLMPQVPNDRALIHIG